MNNSTHITLPSRRSTVSDPSGNSEVAPDEKVLGQYIPLLYHYNMLQDNDRVGAFQEAIHLLVQPDMHVVELGGGTGILSSFAALTDTLRSTTHAWSCSASSCAGAPGMPD